MALRINFVRILNLIISLVNDSFTNSQTSLDSLIKFYLTISIISLCIAIFL